MWMEYLYYIWWNIRSCCHDQSKNIVVRGRLNWLTNFRTNSCSRGLSQMELCRYLTICVLKRMRIKAHETPTHRWKAIKYPFAINKNDSEQKFKIDNNDNVKRWLIFTLLLLILYLLLNQLQSSHPDTHAAGGCTHIHLHIYLLLLLHKGRTRHPPAIKRLQKSFSCATCLIFIPLFLN